VVSLPALPPSVGVVTLAIGVAASLLYVRHARRKPHPILDLSLFRIQVFRAAISGGSIFRIGNGAVPFLLPLMFQLGFGMTPFQSGMLTFASALGAIAMKFLASAMLKTGGFRTVLIAAVLLAACFVAANGLFTPQTSAAIIIPVLIGAGFLRSLFFTAANALVFADVEDRDASQATAIAAASQQISVALGVAIGGGILEATALLTGESVGLSAFSTAFFIVAAITVLSVIPFLGLSADAGNSVSGHRLRDPNAGESPQL
jgi:MFS family permease